MTQDAYTATLAVRHLLCGAAAPRRAMREASATWLGEPDRALLVVASGFAVLLADRRDESIVRVFSGLFLEAGTTTEGIAGTAFQVGIGVAAVLAIYALVASLLWLVTRWIAVPPSHTAIRASLAVGCWIGTFPMIATGIVLHLFDVGPVAALLPLVLGITFVGLCLSEMTGLELGTAMGLASGTFFFGSLSVVVLLVVFADWITSQSVIGPPTISVRIH